MGPGGSSIPWANFLVRVFAQFAAFNEGAEIFLDGSKAAVGWITIWLSIPYIGEKTSQLLRSFKRKLRRHLKSPNTQIRIREKTTKLCFYTNNKDKVPLLNKSHVVYKFSCPGCQSSYIGKTDRTLLIRTRGHAVTDKESAIYKHQRTCEHFAFIHNLFNLPDTLNNVTTPTISGNNTTNNTTNNLKTSKGNPRKTWNLINELTSSNTSKSSNILEIQVDNRTISTPGDMAEAFNDHFTNIGQVLAQEVPAAEVNPEFYLSHTDKAFCLKTPSLDVVINLLRNIDETKATGLDMIPSKLLKMAASIVAPSLTAIFTKSIITGIYPTEWKMARVTPVFKKGVKSNLNNYRPISVIPVVSKVFEKIVYDQLYQYLNDNQLLSKLSVGLSLLT